MVASAGAEHGEAEDQARAAPVEHRADQRRDERRQHAAQRHRARHLGARPAEGVGHRHDEDRQRGDGRSLAREAGQADAGQHDPAVEERQARHDESGKQRRAHWLVTIYRSSADAAHCRAQRGVSRRDLLSLTRADKNRSLDYARHGVARFAGIWSRAAGSAVRSWCGFRGRDAPGRRRPADSDAGCRARIVPCAQRLEGALGDLGQHRRGRRCSGTAPGSRRSPTSGRCCRRDSRSTGPLAWP